jgi:magnesium transporter
VDLVAPSAPESLILSETFGFHPLAVQSAMSSLQFPKIEPYEGYLYVVMHGIDFHKGRRAFATNDIDFFVGRAFLVTVHDGHPASIETMREICPRNDDVMAEGAIGLFHRVVDSMVDSYRPEIEKLEDALDALENSVFENPAPALLRKILDRKRDMAQLRRVLTPQRDVINRLARREFADVSPEMAFRFRDVYDHLVRLNDEIFTFQDRVTGILEAHLSNISNRLNEVMKVLTVITTIFMPLTLLSGMYGMNVELPRFPGGDAAQFWWVAGIMIVLVAAMLTFFYRRRWL